MQIPIAQCTRCNIIQENIIDMSLHQLPLCDVSSTWLVCNAFASIDMDQPRLAYVNLVMGHLVGCLSAGFASRNGNVCRIMCTGCSCTLLPCNDFNCKGDLDQTPIINLLSNICVKYDFVNVD